MRLHVPGAQWIALVAIVLIVAGGLCLLDPPGDHPDTIDLCLLFALPVTGLVLSLALVPAERLVPARVVSRVRTARDPAAPPPRD